MEFFHFNFWSEVHQDRSSLSLLEGFYQQEFLPEIIDRTNFPTTKCKVLENLEVLGSEPFYHWFPALDISLGSQQIKLRKGSL